MPFRDEGIGRIKAIVLVETIKATPGGHKLNFENILFLATHFEADYLPGDAQTLADQVEKILQEQEAKRQANQSF
ncbi:MAG: hypothetical protein JWO19_4404 [Bryobacterales bacterium]|nr:hypothetical protein [Bryobacterales bacterium]